MNSPERTPDSSFPGRDSYGRRSSRTREGGNIGLVVAAVIAVALVLGLLFFFGKTQTPTPPPAVSIGTN